jgi:hypothetical protein
MHNALELDRWAEMPMKFTNSRWKTPIERFREDLYLYSPKAEPYTPDSLRAAVSFSPLKKRRAPDGRARQVREKPAPSRMRRQSMAAPA